MVCRLLKLLESYYLQTHLKITDDLEITLKLKFNSSKSLLAFFIFQLNPPSPTSAEFSILFLIRCDRDHTQRSRNKLSSLFLNIDMQYLEPGTVLLYITSRHYPLRGAGKHLYTLHNQHQKLL